MLVLTFSTGIVDAIGYLGLDRVFTANMTGNVLILGMAATGADTLPVRGPAVALAVFLLGTAVAGRAQRQTRTGWTRTVTRLLLADGIVLAGAAIALALGPSTGDPALALPVTAALSAAMGLQAGAARQVAVKDLPTVVITSTLVGLAYDSPLGTGQSQHWQRRALALLMLCGGAGLGAVLLRVDASIGTALAAAVVLLVAVAGRHNASGTAPSG